MDVTRDFTGAISSKGVAGEIAAQGTSTGQRLLVQMATPRVFVVWFIDGPVSPMMLGRHPVATELACRCR